MKSDKEWKGALQKTQEGTHEISTYTGGMLTDRVLASSIKKLQVAFPKQAPGFFNILAERLIANGFTDERVQDAVNYLIDNFAYKELNIADVVKFDRRVRVYTHQEVSSLVTQNKASFEDFEIREINGRIFRIKKSDTI